MQNTQKTDRAFSRQDMLIALGIILLAFILRLVVIVDRAHDPVVGAFDPLPAGTDQATYYSHIAAFADGTFPPRTFHFQPGMSYFLIGASKLVRSDNVGALRVFFAALASLNCGVVMAAVHLVFGRRRVSVLAALLLAIYPVGVFYDTDFVITAQATQLLSLALLGVFWLWIYPRHWIGALLTGASFGLLAITRFELIFLAPVFGVWLLAMRRDARAVLQVALAAVMCGAIIGPVVRHNQRGGAGYVITSAGSMEIYRGNNRDTYGDNNGGSASESTRDEYLHYLWLDVRLEPQRFVELQLHKIGMALSANEPGNNLNYVISGENISPLLRAIPLDFRILLTLATLGYLALWRRREPVVWLLGPSFLVMVGTMLLIWVEARVRTPAILFLIPPAAYGLVDLAESFPVRYRRDMGGWLADWRQVRAMILVPAAAIILVNGFSYAAEYHLPRKLTVGALPDTAAPTSAVFDGNLELVGWEIQEEYSRAGIIQPFKPYVVTLYWRLKEATSTRYGYSLTYVIDGQRVLDRNQWAGSVNAPERFTGEWEPRTIYVEHVTLGYRSYEGGPRLASGYLLLSVWTNPDGIPLLPAEGIAGSPLHVELSRPALIWDQGGLPDDLPLAPAPVRFGKELRLLGWDYPPQGAPGETITARLGWQTTDEPIAANYILALYLFDDAGNFTGVQADGPPVQGRLLTSSIPTDFKFLDTKQITLPADPGTYRLYAGVYDYQTQERLAVSDDPRQTLYDLGPIIVRD